jgi:hypothetical protein
LKKGVVRIPSWVTSRGFLEAELRGGGDAGEAGEGRGGFGMGSSIITNGIQGNLVAA